jgi:hypothetical protein
MADNPIADRILELEIEAEHLQTFDRAVAILTEIRMLETIEKAYKCISGVNGDD